MTPLFDSDSLPPSRRRLDDGALLLRGFARSEASALLDEVARIAQVAMTNCGEPWPAMPGAFQDLALRAAAEAGFANYDPDACLINRYVAGARLSLHQDRDEKDAWAPIVSVSLGLPAVFLWGGPKRSDPVRRLRVENGDVAVWGGPARFTYHGIAPLKGGQHPLTGAARMNLTFRKVF